MPLYRIDPQQKAVQVKPANFSRERDLQKLFEANLESLLAVRFVASEFTTGDRQRGRIDTLGLDQDGYPTIIEYKKSNKENIINQGLFYMDWLVDHKGDFALAAQKALGNEIKIDWSRPRLLLVAESFSDYDQYAVNRIGANIDLWTYRLYGDDLLYLNAIFEAPGQPARGKTVTPVVTVPIEESEADKPEAPVYTLDDHLARKPREIQELFQVLRERIFALGEPGEIVEKANKMYVGYKHGKNFCEVRLQSKILQIWLDFPPAELEDPYHLVRDVSKIGHYGTGNSEVRLTNLSEMDRVMNLIEQSFRQTV
jgi:predicted transport protein